ncbi:MAG: NAD-binding protein [Desulfovibrionaceae bacterium]|nr:NAD-binding protein [Desulfovibrionaceae bacterium]
MKSPLTQVFMFKENNKRHLRFILRFILGMLLLIFLYSLIFQQIMRLEEREYGFWDGVYWTTSTMSTLGFGDIVFQSALGRIFSILVLFSGVLFFMLLMPFIFIRFIYQPWLEAHKQSKVPRGLPEGLRDHVLILGVDDIALQITDRLIQHKIPCYLMVSEQHMALSLFDQGLPVLHGETDNPETWIAAQLRKAAMVVLLQDNLKNTSIAALVRDLAPSVLLASSATSEHAEDILQLAGCSQVFNFTRMLGEAMGRRVFAGKRDSNIIAWFEDLHIAETRAGDTPLVGKSLRQLNLRVQLGLNVVGIRQGRDFSSAHPDTVIDESMVLLLAGQRDNLEKFGEYMRPMLDNLEEAEAGNPVLVLGGGRVGMAVVDNLNRRALPFTLLDKNPARIKKDDPRFVLGEAEDIQCLREAGLEQANSVVITTHNDDLNIYLTLFCRKLRPEIQVIARCNLVRNIRPLYQAGASLVIAISSIAANSIMNILIPDKIFMLTEGVNVFRLPLPPALHGQTLRQSGIRQQSNCNAVALCRDGKMLVNMDPDMAMENGDELILIGSREAEQDFMKRFPPE